MNASGADDMRLIDHHCHGLLRTDLDRAGFESALTEAARPGPLGTSLFDSLIGHAVLRWCPPVLGLPATVGPDDYLVRRAELGATEVNRRFLLASGIERFLVDGGFRPADLTSAAELGALVDRPADDIVRLETVAERVARSGVDAAGFAYAVTAELGEAARTAVGCKTIAAYRVGLDLAGDRPSANEVTAAAGRFLSEVDATGIARLADPVLHRFLIWQGIDLRLPVQVHVGYGDSDVDLFRCDPTRLTGLLRATESASVPIVLLHNYPFHRHAGYLAQVFGHVFVDLSLATHNVGVRAGAVLGELLELAPFGKVLFATDAAGLAELYHLGALLFRRGLAEFLDSSVDRDADRVRALIGAENAIRVYGSERRSAGQTVVNTSS